MSTAADPKSALEALPIETPAAQPFATVLADEKKTIRELRTRRGVGDSAGQESPTNLFGLALSGGGIRSATLSLGILQAFAKNGLLKRVDYLSTVSGGGYIGSWLTAFIHRQGLSKATESLNPEPSPGADPRPISWLRQFSNYLTPNLSMFNADTWSMAAIWSRNTLLNLIILVTAIASLLLVPRMAGLALLKAASAADFEELPYLLCTRVPLIIATGFIGFNLAAFARKKNPGWLGTQLAIQWLIVLPTFLAAFSVSAWLAVHVETFSGGGFWDGTWRPCVGFFVLYAVILITGDFASCFNEQHRKIPQWARVVAGSLLELMIAAVSAFLTAALIRLLADFVETWPVEQRVWPALTFGPSLVMLVFALGVIIQIGLMGADLPDAAREWLGRLRAWMMIFSTAWLAFALTSIYGPLGIAAVGAWWGKTGIGLVTGWITTTVAGIFAGKSDKSGGQGASGQSTSSSTLDIIAGVGPYVFMAGFLLAISFGVHILTSHVDASCAPPPPTAAALPACRICAESSADGKTVKLTAETSQKTPSNQFLADLQNNYWRQMNGQVLWDFAPGKCISVVSVVANLFGILAVACALFAWRVDINEFSLHHFYRNRLVRAYLGATTRHRQPNPFTGFDNKDDIHLARLLDAPKPDDDEESAKPTIQYDGPYPILNATLNLSVGRNLAWQEREATSFIFTPLYTGFDTGYERPSKAIEHSRTSRSARVDEVDLATDVGDAPVDGLARYAYESTRAFGSVGPGLGTAMAISGAAANPNHGYHTSTVVAFLMTVFDVRLGWWMANPRRPKMLRYVGPAFGFGYLVKELLGLTDARTKFVNLSDGGHFDNMGVYELVRRRCRYIVVCDGEQDQDLTFEGLAGAIRKCRIDFDTEICIDLDKIRKKKDKDGPAEFSQAHCAVGRIHYPEDRGKPDVPENRSYLLYFKSSLTGDEPADVLQYHSQEPLFPHQSTADQWFDESQFESYRRLGLHIGSKVLKGQDSSDLALLFKNLDSKDWGAADQGDKHDCL
jgi:hypothetical protein